VLYFGRLSHEKGLRDVISAAARLRHVEFVIAGDGPQSSELQSLQQALRLNNLRFTGQLSGAALEQLIAQSQFTLFPSHAYETFGKSILESFAHGRTVIASDLGSRRALVTDGETGLLYRVGDVDQLVEAIEGLRCDPELARQMGLAGRDRARRDFCHETHFQALTTLYDELIARRRSHPNTGRALKVAFIGGRGVGGKYSGIETCYEKVGERLAAKHVDITAYCRSYFTPNIANYRGIRVLRLPTIPSKHLDTVVHTLLSTVHACFHDFDIVHYHTLGPSLFSFVPRLLGKKTVVTVQGLDWQRKKWSLLPRTVLQIGEWTSVKFPNKTIVVSQALQQYYQSRYARSVRYIPNATEVRNRNASGALQNLHLAPGGYVLFLGRLSPEKNCHVLIQAFEQVASPAMSLVLAGGSSHTDKYVSALRRHANERVVFLDWVSGSNKDALLTNAALFVLPSDMEGLSLALLDAMGAGICVLASDTPENCEAIADAGFTFHCGDVGDLTEMLRFLLDHPKVRADYGHKAQMRVRQQYLWDEVVNQHMLVYSDLTARSKGLRLAAPDAPTRRAA
jgi:glycosyltransferase involved in cell wall biosynthesis